MTLLEIIESNYDSVKAKETMQSSDVYNGKRVIIKGLVWMDRIEVFLSGELLLVSSFSDQTPSIDIARKIYNATAQ